MSLRIKLPKKRLKAFKKHLEKEHPSTKGKIKMSGCDTIHGFKNNIPDFEEQAEEMTRI